MAYVELVDREIGEVAEEVVEAAAE
jgi:hypothetical protein